VPTRRHLAVVTSSRADLAHLIWPLRALAEAPGLELTVMACGTALAPEYGAAAERLVDEGFAVVPVGSPMGVDTPHELARAVGLLTSDFADAFARMQPDLLLVIADRAEMLAPATAALAMRIPIVHIEGGECSEGAIDNAVRNALTAMSHVHLVTTRAARQRVIGMGEEPWRVHHVGAASLDHLRHAQLPSVRQVLEPLGLEWTQPIVLVAVHPTTLAADPCADACALLEALTMLDEDGTLNSTQVLFAFPNADDGGREVRSHCDTWGRARLARCKALARLVTQLPAESWFALLRDSATLAILGNSSSIVMEAPAVGLPGVLIGERQRGRELGPWTAWVSGATEGAPFASPEPGLIAEAIRRALENAEAHRIAWPTTHPYGDGRTSARIVQAIASLPDRDELLDKRAPAEIEAARLEAPTSASCHRPAVAPPT